MRSSARRCLALLLALGLVAPPAALAQELPASPQPPAEVPAPQPPASAASPAATTAASLSGHWQGWARLLNDWPGLACHYEGSADAVSVNLELTNDGGRVHGSVAIDLPPEQGSGCPPLRKRYSVDDVSTGPDTASFTDSGGNEWTLAVRRAGSVLQGLLAWREGGPDQPLAEGFARPDGVRPPTRLSGEVRVRRPDVPETGAAASATAAPPASGAAAPAKAGVGHHAKNWAAIIGVNVIGLGLLYAVNKYGKGSSGAGVLTCSARYCIVGAPNAPCFCENENITTGASCKATQGGVPPGGQCDNQTLPCQSGFSCNSGVCEDRFGRCVF